ncbi:MAG: 1-acyl-sn-glycerol-3-phosphate acyltransferase [Saprospiraceae bacterium]|nr:1-acyl-sn-glycerol-3-phosphate acyltransferase [Saprospiraceae bacterium]
MGSLISRLLLKFWGFKIRGDVGNHFPKKVYAVVPHTSNWDFPLGLLVRSAGKISVNFIAKDSLFLPPFGFVFRCLGGYPVDRSKSTNFVDTMVNFFRQEEQFAIVIAPEGTRKKVDRLRTGFYHIARQAQVPIICISFDFGKKEVVFREPINPEDEEQDFAKIYAFFEGAVGKNPASGFEIKQ